MKKLYFTILTLLLFIISTAQSTLVVIDRDNISAGSTLTGNSTGVSSVGFTRGSGVNFRPGGTNHTSNNWGASDQPGAASSNEYLEWSVSAQPTFTVVVNEIDIRLRRNNTGPENFRIFYSLDGFATAGIPAIPEQITPSSATNFNFDGLTITSPEGGTITFRLYAWNASNTTAGWFRIARNNGWNDLGVSGAGARLIGTATSSSTNDILSDIIAEPTFTHPENIDYITYNVSSGLNLSNAEVIAEFTIRDIVDSDTDPTILTDIEFQIINPEYLRALAIYDDGVFVAEVTSISSFTTFSNLNGGSGIIAPSGGTNSFQVLATFTADVVDNEQFQLIISSASTPVSGSSLFEFGDAGGAVSSVDGDDNRIEVIAGELAYDQNVSNVNQFELMIPFVTLIAQDANTNQDLDYSGLVSLTTTGTFDSEATIAVSAINGLATFSNLIFSETASDITITATAPSFFVFTSATFDVDNAYLTLAVQDFDGSGPEWPVNNVIDYFDNGWGVEGYYGPINISSASPLDFSFFSGNILGENDLQDTENGNGTTGFARLSFDDVDVSGFNNVKIIFDWQVTGYDQNRNDLRYRVFIDGVGQSTVLLFDGNNAPTEGSGREVIDIPDGTSTVDFYIEQRNNRITGFSGLDNFRVVTEFDGLIYRNGTWFPSAPDEFTGTDDVLINSGTYSITDPIEVNDFIVGVGSTVNVDPGETVLTNGTLINNGTFNLNSTSTLFSSILPTEVDNFGSLNYSRYVNIAGTSEANGGNDLISIPLLPDSGQGFNQFLDLGSPTNDTKLFTNGVLFAFAPYNNAVLNFENFGVSGTNPLQRGIGYRVATTTGENLTFSGDALTTDLTGIPVSTPVSGSQWNLIGNPYPSYISSLEFISTNTDVFDPSAAAIYGYHSGTNTGGPGTRDNYTIVNNVSNNTINIAPGQGFFIAAQNTEGFSDTVDFLASMRTLTGNNDFILSRDSNSEPLHIQLKLENSKGEEFTDIYFHEDATKGLDPGFDAAVFGSGAGTFALYSHLIENNEGRDMAIQTIGLNDFESAVIPLGINIAKGNQVSLSIAETNIPKGIEIFLEDKLTNSFTRLNSSDFVFTASNTLTSPGRFYLRFTNNSLSINENNLNEIQIYANQQKEIVINGLLSRGSEIRIYDLQGRLVLKDNLITQNNHYRMNASKIASGPYIVRINSQNLQKSQKIILR